jgi:nucleoside-diphosphate-sugar epimerase
MILITGGGGFLGLNIAQYLVDKGQEVLLVQRHSVKPPSFLIPFWSKEIKQATGNILDLPFLLGLAKEYSIESIIHGAFDNTSLLNREGPIKEHLHQFVQVPVQGCINLLEIARLYALRRVTLISSVVAYMGAPGESGEWREETLLPSVSFSMIGNIKKAMEQICFLYSNIYEFSFVSLRVGYIYGPASEHRNPITNMIENALAGRPANISMVPEDWRTPMVYAKDAGYLIGLIHLAETLKSPIYNIAARGNPSMFDAARLIRELIQDAKVTLGPVQPGQPEFKEVNLDKIEKEFGFVPRELKEGIKAFIDWIKEGKY